MNVLGAGLSLALGMFVLETLLSHFLALLGYGWDGPLTLGLWLEHLGLYLAAGVVVSVLPGAIHLRRDGRAEAAQELARWSWLGMYATLLVGPRLVPVMGGAAFFVVALMAGSIAVVAWRARARAAGGRLDRLLRFGLWTGLIWLGCGAILNLRVLGGSILLARNLVANGGLLLVSAVLAGWLARGGRAGTKERGGLPGRSAPDGRPGVTAVGWLERWKWRVLGGGALYLGVAIAAAMGLRAPGAPSREAPTSDDSAVPLSVVPASTVPGTDRTASAVPASGPPDILLIIVDTLRADRLGSYGYSAARTPNLDALARRSTRYDLHLSSSPWTYPSVASILTGRSPSAHQATMLTDVMGRRADRGRFGARTLRRDLPTLATVLHARGYETGLIATNPYLTAVFGFDRGFDHYEVLQRSGARYVTLAAALAAVGWRPLDPGDPTLPAGEMTARFAAWLDRPRTRPRLLVAHYMDPHFPYHPPARFREGLGRPPAERERPVERLSALYDGEIAYVDEEIGALLHRLEASGHLKHTVVAVTSDHGETFLDHGTWVSWDEMPDGFDPYARRGIDHGQSEYQELIRVPFILYRPGQAPGVVSRMTSAVDLLPTLLNAAGAPIPSGLEGRDLTRLDETASGPPAPALSEALLSGLEKKSWCDGIYKLIYKPDYPSGERLELYHLRTDPGERRNLARVDPERATSMERALLKRLLELTGPGSAAAPAMLDRATIERLEALGYLGKGGP